MARPNPPRATAPAQPRAAEDDDDCTQEERAELTAIIEAKVQAYLRQQREHRRRARAAQAEASQG